MAAKFIRFELARPVPHPFDGNPAYAHSVNNNPGEFTSEAFDWICLSGTYHPVPPQSIQDKVRGDARCEFWFKNGGEAKPAIDAMNEALACSNGRMSRREANYLPGDVVWEDEFQIIRRFP